MLFLTASAPAAGVAAGECVTAPIPGNILKVNVSEGQAVNEGDLLMHSIGVNVSGQIASVIAGGIILSMFR